SNVGELANNECWQCRSGGLPFICLAAAAAFAGMLTLAMHVSRAGGARLTQAAGRNKRWLVLAINRDQWVRHFLSSRGNGAWCWLGRTFLCDIRSMQTSGPAAERRCEWLIQESSSLSSVSSGLSLRPSQGIGSAG